MEVDAGAVAPIQLNIAGAEDARAEFAPRKSEAAERAQSAELASPPDLTAARLAKLTRAGYNAHARLSIDRDEDAGSFVYRILDDRSGELIRQFPQEEMLQLLAYLGEQGGLVVDRKV